MIYFPKQEEKLFIFPKKEEMIEKKRFQNKEKQKAQNQIDFPFPLNFWKLYLTVEEKL